MRVVELAARQIALWEGDANPAMDPCFAKVRDFLISGSPTNATRAAKPRSLRGEGRVLIEWLQVLAARDGAFAPPYGAVYINIAQHALHNPVHTRWLEGRRDIKPVFLVHDVIPIDFPQFFRSGHSHRFAAMLRTIRRHAAGLIVTCEATKTRIATHFETNGTTIPIHVAHLPVDARFSRGVGEDPELARAPYAMMVGTIEPRKNHLLLLNLWKRFVAQGAIAPRLLIVGGIGWKCDAILEMLRRSPELQGLVMLVSDLSDAAYRHFLRHARALLLPSTMEGYGLPLVEAAAMGVPVIASNIDVFREVCQGKGEFISPNDDDSWARAILELGDKSAAARRRDLMATFVAPTWDQYIDGVLRFLRTL